MNREWVDLNKIKVLVLLAVLAITMVLGCGCGKDSYYYEQGEPDESELKIRGTVKSENGSMYTLFEDNSIKKYDSTGVLENEIKLDIPEETKRFINGMGVDDEENIYVDAYEIGPQIGNEEKKHNIWKFDKNGKKEEEVPVSDNDSIGFPMGGFNQIYATQENGFMYVNDNTLLIETDSTGKQIGTIIKNKVLDYVKVGDCIYAAIEENDETFLIKKELGKNDYDFKVETDNEVVYAKIDYDKNKNEIVYLSSQLELKSYDEKGNKVKSLGNSIDFPIFLNNLEILSLAIGENEDIVLTCMIISKEQAEFANVTLVKKEGSKPGSGKKLVSVGANSEDEKLALKILATEFMKENPEVIIEVNNYNYTKETSSDYLKKINTEMMSGEGDDLIPTQYLPMSKFMKNGVFQELNEYMDGNESSQYYENVLDGFKYDGKYYALPYSFTISGLVVDKNSLKQYKLEMDQETFTRNDFINMMRELKSNRDNPCLAKMEKAGLIKALFLPEMQNWINYKDNTTNFNDATFDNLIEDVETIANGELMSKDMDMLDAKKSGRETELVFEVAPVIELYGFESVTEMKNYRDDFKICPVPLEQSLGEYAFNANGYGLNRMSENKDIAWKFMKYISQKFGLDGYYYSFNPVIEINEGVIDKLKDMEKKPFVFISDDLVLYNHPIGKETGEELKRILENAKISINLDPQIELIITEAFEKYSNGEISKEKLKNDLDSKIQTYLKE